HTVHGLLSRASRAGRRPTVGVRIMPQRHLPALALACALALLSACDSAEERAEKHFQSAVALVEAGDIDRAMVEFRNVFKLNGRHEEARVAYAGLLRENGRLQEAYGQYLRLVEQHPQNIEGRRALTEMALETGNWEEVERHAAAAAALAPDDPLVRAVTVALAYRKALEAKDAAAQATARTEAVALLKTQPGLIVARRVVIDDLIRQNDWEAALAEIDAGLATAPGALDLYTLRLGLLQEMGDTAAIEAQLNDMVARFPTDENSQRMLVGWHIQQGNLDAAEAHLRGRIDPADEKPDAQIVLIEFLQRYRGVAAAREEIARVIAAGGPRTRPHRPVPPGRAF